MHAAPSSYGERLRRSFAAVYAALEVPTIARRAVVVLLVIHTFLLAYSAYVHSPTLNEPGHLVAGLSHWKFGRFEVYRVNPPLVKMVAALPVMAAGYKEDWSGFYDGPGARPEMAMGENFVAANGERSFFLFMIARWACIPFSWLGAIVCYLWARDLYGRPSGIFACAIWCFEPNILAHASLMTPDAGATALGLAACYTFWRWLRNPTWTQAALTGVVLGLAELAKTTLILFYPLWPLMWIVYRLLPSPIGRGLGEGALPPRPLGEGRGEGQSRMSPRDWLREAGMLALRMLIGLYVLNLGYGFEGSCTQLKDFHFVSDLFSGEERRARSEATAASPQPPAPSPPSTNRFANTWLGGLPVPFPKNYLLGIDLQQKDFEHYGRPSYLRGEWRNQGWWYYYLYACAIKVPLALWALGLLAILLSLRERLSEGPPLAHCRLPTADGRDFLILLFPAIVIFSAVSSKTGFSEHMRYVLPTFPFFFIGASQIVQAFSPNFAKAPAGYLTATKYGVHCATVGPNWRLRYVPLFSTSLVSILGSWLIASSVWVYPHSLSYFNESIGGPLNGSEYLLGSNVDWGQDLGYVQQLVSASSDEKPIQFAYYARYSTSSVWNDRIGTGRVDLRATQLKSTSQSKSLESNLADMRCHRYVVSVNLLCGDPRTARSHANNLDEIQAWPLALLRQLPAKSGSTYTLRYLEISTQRLNSH